MAIDDRGDRSELEEKATADEPTRGPSNRNGKSIALFVISLAPEVSTLIPSFRGPCKERLGP